MSPSKPRLLYIAGLAHCGSTYLSRVLNQHSEIVSAGELLDLHLIDEPDNPTCACQVDPSDTDECSFWSGIRRRLRDESIDPARTARLSLDRTREWRRALGVHYGASSAEEFIQGNRRLLDILGEETGASVIVDSSKSPWRLLPLLDALPDRLHILFLKRRPKDQIASRLKRDHGFWRSAILKYLRKHVLFRHFFAHHPRFQEVAFEGFVHHPDRTLTTIFDHLGLHPEPIWEEDPAPFHHLRGNRNVRSSRRLRSPDPEKLVKDHDYTPGQEIVLGLLHRLAY